mgnify:CR=1 FL=1
MIRTILSNIDLVLNLSNNKFDNHDNENNWNVTDNKIIIDQNNTSKIFTDIKNNNKLSNER